MSKLCLSFFLLVCISFGAHADWQLDGESSKLNFVSVKKDTIAELHQFTRMQGKIDSAGKARLAVDLASVDTKIAIRDERMKEHLFKVAQFPELSVAVDVDAEFVASMTAGEFKTLPVNIQVSLHGKQKRYEQTVSVFMAADKSLHVQSVAPLMINAADFELLKGIETLQSLAALPSISPIVPVTFLLRFTAIN